MKHCPFIFVLINSYRNSKFSLAMLMASLIIAASGLSAVLVINNSAKQSYDNEKQFLIPNINATIVAKTPSKKLTKQDYAALRIQGFNHLVAIAQTRQHVYSNQKKLSKRRIDFTGIDTFSLITLPLFSMPQALSQPQVLSKTTSAEQKNKFNKTEEQQLTDSFLQQLSFNKATAILHPQLLNNLQAAADVADGIIFTTKSERALPELVALEDAALGNDIIMDISQLFRLYPDASLTMLLVVGEISAKQQSALQGALPEHLQFKNTEKTSQNSELTNSFHLNLMAMALLMFVVCLFIVVNAVNLLLNGRLAWLKICRQLGISRLQLFTVQLLEIILLTSLASLVGVFLGIELAKLASPNVQATLENLYQVQVGFGQVSITGLLLQVLGICLVGSVCAIFIPLSKLNHQLAHTKDLPLSFTQQRFWKRVIWASFVSFASLGFFLLHNVQELWLLLVATACVILSGCSLLLANYPRALALVQSIIPTRYPLLQVSAKQSVALSGKTKIACCAFFIAATSNIGMNLMVDSFRGATVGWLDQRLAADYYVYNSGEPKITELAHGTGVNAYQRLENYVQFKGRKIQQFSYPTDKFNQQAMSFYENSESDRLWEQFTLGEGVLVNQQFSFGLNYEVGDTIDLPHPTTGETASYPILGIIYDFGSPYAQVLMPINMFDAAKSKSYIYAIQGDESAIVRLREVMLKAGLDPSIQLIKTEDLLAMSMQAFDNTFVITDGLNVVTLLVAALSLACAIIVLMNDVRPQNMLIRSMGVSAMKTQLLALFQYLQLCLVALIFATPFGILLSWILIFDINYQAFSWTYPLIINPLKIVQIYATSLLVVTAIIAIPIVRAGRKPLIEDIRWVN
ncbi:MAG: putative ABC transport system permease protein [Glaciecola sp.]|jgi:putative ABC transport system permease protein